MQYRPVDLSKIKTYSVKNRHHKTIYKPAALPQAGCSARDLISSLPHHLAASSFRKVVQSIVQAHQAKKAVVFAMGAHLVKVGCSPIVIDLMERGIVTAIVSNGATAIHDVELALFGETSEEVESSITDGSFGMVNETLGFFKEVASHCAFGKGLGTCIGEVLDERKLKTRSIFHTARKAKIPACVHIAIGTDTIHMADIDISELAESSMYDFKILCDIVSNLGVWINIGSAVILPEVFLKAITVARNLGTKLDDIVTANFDMIRHYRPHQNVVTRPVRPGHGFEIIGHHEIMLPLLRQAIIENLP